MQYSVLYAGPGLAMDAFAVSMSSGTTVRPFRVSHAFKLAFIGGKMIYEALYGTRTKR